jgi:tripeptide aminopeptidase
MSEADGNLNRVLSDRFVRYARIHTSSDGDSESSPSTDVQMAFLGVLRKELEDMGMEDVELDGGGTLYATLPGGGGGNTVIGLLAHVDTSPEAPGEGVQPQLHSDWDGSPISLRDGQTIDPDETEDMNRYLGGTIITSDGTTLLGADDKAGVAVIMEVCRTLMEDPGIPRPPIRIAFTSDEEVGRGMNSFDAGRFGADMAYTVDGGPVGRVDSQTFNAWSAEFRIKGREVHPGSAKGILVNAVRILSDIVSGLKPEEMPENSSGCEGYIYPISISASASEGKLKLILRDFESRGMENRLSYVRDLESWMNSRYPGAEIQLELKEQYSNPSEVLQKDRRVVEYALLGTRAAGLEPEESSIRGGTDGSRLSFMGVPTVNLPTGGELFHSRKEWVAEEGLRFSYDILLETLKIWGGERSSE